MTRSRRTRPLFTTTTLAATAALLAGVAGPAPSASAATSVPSALPVSAQQALPDRPLLRLGDTGQAVAAWQRQLILITGADLTVDGVYGTMTEQATTDFQRFFDMRADGIVGEDTRGLMRYLLAVQRDYTHLATFDEFEAVGYPTESGYCFELRAGDEVAIRCGIVTPYRLAAATMALGDRTVLLGTADPGVDRVMIETDDGRVLPAELRREVRASNQNVWVSPVFAPDVAAVRGLAPDGSEIRRIVVDDGDTILVLERGDRGQAVAAWQGKLNVATGADLATDGVFGSRTVQATMDFQRFFGLTPDGIVGPQTRDVLDYIYSLKLNQ